MTIPDSPALDLDALTALEQAATPAPWEAHMVQPNMAGNHQWYLHPVPRRPAGVHATGRGEDIDLIVAMRNQLPALLSALTAARAEAETYKREVGHADSEREEAERHRDAAREQARQAQAELRDAKLTIAARDAALDASTETHRIAQQIVLATLGATSTAAPKVTCSCQWSPVQGRIWCDSCATARDAVVEAAAAPQADEPSTWPDCGRGVAGGWCRHPVNHQGDCSPKSRKLALPAAAPGPAPRCCPNHREPGEARYGCATAPGVTDPCCNECHYWVAWTRYLDGHDDEDADPVPAGGEDGSGTADGEVPA